jgi:hypothetical protein
LRLSTVARSRAADHPGGRGQRRTRPKAGYFMGCCWKNSHIRSLAEMLWVVLPSQGMGHGLGAKTAGQSHDRGVRHRPMKSQHDRRRLLGIVLQWNVDDVRATSAIVLQNPSVVAGRERLGGEDRSKEEHWSGTHRSLPSVGDPTFGLIYPIDTRKSSILCVVFSRQGGRLKNPCSWPSAVNISARCPVPSTSSGTPRPERPAGRPSRTAAGWAAFSPRGAMVIITRPTIPSKTHGPTQESCKSPGQTVPESGHGSPSKTHGSTGSESANRTYLWTSETTLYMGQETVYIVARKVLYEQRERKVSWPDDERG